MNILLIRHGETDGNKLNVFQGHSDIGLNRKGKSQAKLVAERLISETIDIAFVSDLRRAKETATYILSFHPKAEVTFTSCLRERSFGTYEGKSFSSFEDALHHSGQDLFSYQPPQGESLQDLSSRVTGFFMEILQEQHAQNILIVGHRDWLTMFHLFLLKLEITNETYIRYMPNNAAVSKVHMIDDRAKYSLLNCTRHL